MVTTKWIKRAILWCFRFSLALGGQCVIFGIIYGNLFVLRFLWYSSADQGTFYPASRGYIFAVWAGVRKCQLIPRKCSLCSQGRNMQILHAEFDKKIFFHIYFHEKIILIPLELKLLLNDKMINYKKRDILTLLQLKNLRTGWTTFRNIIRLMNPSSILSVLFICFLF